MGSRSPKQARRRKAAAPEVALPTPSITLDVAVPLPDGTVDQSRPTFNDFDKAMAYLLNEKLAWRKALVAHKKAARAKR